MASPSSRNPFLEVDETIVEESVEDSEENKQEYFQKPDQQKRKMSVFKMNLEPPQTRKRLASTANIIIPKIVTQDLNRQK